MVLGVLGDVLCVWGVYNLWRHVQSTRSGGLGVLGDALCISVVGIYSLGSFWVLYGSGGVTGL